MTAPTDWVELTAACGRCDRQDSVSVPEAKYAEWKGGANIAWVFKNLSPQQREILMGYRNGWFLCSECWLREFGPTDFQGNSVDEVTE